MNFSDLFTAIGHGAASVYHQAVTTGIPPVEWVEAHPEIEPLLALGAKAAGSLLASAGVPVVQGTIIAEDIAIALRAMAATDATVRSGDR